MKRTAITLALLMVVLLSGCASFPKSTPEEDSTAKRFQPVAEKATIYLYRNESMGGAVSMKVDLDEEYQGSTGPMSYFRWVVEPGKHTITSGAENTDSINIDTEANKLYYVWQEVKMGLLSARNKLQIMDEQQGQKAVQECSLIDVAAAKLIK